MHRLIDVAIKAQILLRHELRREHDLAGVQCEMLHHVHDGLKYRKVVSLHLDALHKALRRQCADDGVGFVYSRLQTLAECASADPATRGKLLVSYPNISSAANSANDPLADVSREMKHKVSHRILIL